MNVSVNILKTKNMHTLNGSPECVDDMKPFFFFKEKRMSYEFWRQQETMEGFGAELASHSSNRDLEKVTEQ